MALAACVLWHPDSVSSSRLTLAGRELDLELRCQVRTLLEACPWVDRDSDGALTQAELDAARERLALYLGEHHSVTVSATAGVLEDARTDGEQVAFALDELRLVRGELRGALPGEELVDWFAHGTCSVEPRELAIATTLFRESDPWHRDHAEIVWNGSAPAGRLLWVEDPRWVFAPDGAPRASVFGAYVALGVEHIATGYDHIAFLLALIVASRRLRGLLGVVTAFTLAHSLTLALAAFGVFDLPANVVEPVIALSIAWVGVRDTFVKAPARLWPEAFGFGLVHGLGFAGSIAETLAAEREQLQGLVGFNLGVEAGQLAIVAVCVIALRVTRRAHAGAPETESALAPAGLRRAAGAIVALLGVYWFVERVFT